MDWVCELKAGRGWDLACLWAGSGGDICMSAWEWLRLGRGGPGRLPGVSGSSTLLRFSRGGVRAVGFPHREPGGPGRQ